MISFENPIESLNHYMPVTNSQLIESGTKKKKKCFMKIVMEKYKCLGHYLLSS